MMPKIEERFRRKERLSMVTGKGRRSNRPDFGRIGEAPADLPRSPGGNQRHLGWLLVEWYALINLSHNVDDILF
jgi:hypothetical protein